MSRLEEIKEKAIIEKAHFKNIETGESGWTKTVTLSEEHFNHIIQQAERVEKLEKYAQEFKEGRDETEKALGRANSKIDDYKQALEEIARGSYSGASYIALQALKGDTP